MRRARSEDCGPASLAGADRSARPRRAAGERPRVCVAQIGAPHGVRGEVRLRAFTQDPRDVTRYGPLEVEDASRTLEIEAIRCAGDRLVARFAGVTDRSAAAALRNLELYVPRARLPEPEEETYYHGDLIGLLAVDADGAVAGKIRAVQNFGAGDLLEIAPQGGGATFLVPFTKNFVPEVDVASGRITIRSPDSLLADASSPEGEVVSHARRARRSAHPEKHLPPHLSPRGEGGGCG